MSRSFGYLIPKKTFEIGQFKEFITDASQNNNPAFEYVEIHDTVNNRIIPDCTEDSYGAKCNSCKATLDDGLSDVLMNVAGIEFDNGIETDMTQLTIECHNCNYAYKITDIDFDLPVRFKNQFVCFVEIDSEFDYEKIMEVAHKPGCTFDILYGRI